MIKKILIFSLISVSVLAQVKTYTPIMKPTKYYLYTFVTGTATVSDAYTQIFGSEIGTLSTLSNPLASPRSPIRWMVLLPSDSSQGLSKIIYNLTDDALYTYRHSGFVYANDGTTDWYTGLVDTFTTNFTQPLIRDEESDTNKIYFWVYDESITNVIDSIRIYKSGVYDTTFFDEGIYTDSIFAGAWYSAIGYATYSNRQFKVYSSGADSLYIEPIIPVVPPITGLDTIIVAKNYTRFSFTPSTGDSTIAYYKKQSLPTYTRVAQAGSLDTLGFYGLTPSTNYEVYFVAKENTGSVLSQPTDNFIWRTYDEPSPPASTVYPPINFTSTAHDTTHISYAWADTNTVITVDSFYLHYKLSTASTYDSVFDAASPVTISGLSASSTYQAYVQAVHNGVRSASTNIVSVTTDALWSPPPTIVYTMYVTKDGAGNHDGLSLPNAKNLTEARNTVVAGDYVFVQRGNYTVISFTRSGTLENPIIWEGEMNATDYLYTTNSVNGTNSTLFQNTISGSNPAFSVSGAYNYFRKIVMQQNYPARQLLSVSGEGVMLDSCAVRYPSNSSSTSNHTIVVTGKGVTFKYTTFKYGSRTIIWVRKNSGTQADFFTMENCIIAGASNHPPIQIMPATNSTDTTTIKRPIVRNCLFIDNPYGDGIYSRYCEQFAFYNNLFYKSDSPFNIDIHTGFHYPTGAPQDTCNSKGGIVAYNTIIVEGQANIIFNKGSNQTKFVNNVIYSTDPAPDMIFRLDGDWNAIYRHQFDYNLYDYTENLASGNTVRGTWGTGNTSVWYYNWDNITSQETHTTIDITPTWNNTNPVGGYKPPNVNAPQVGKGIRVTIANGFFMDIIVDAFGNPRDAVSPTIGYSNYIGEE